MSKIKRINCYGHKFATEKWWCDHITGINRLYHIHGGKGGCYHNGKKYEFIAGRVYYIPFTDSFKPYTDADDPILHTYADFELVPPIITNEILSVDADDSEMLSAAVSVFDAGGKEQNDVFPLCTESILYILKYIAKQNEIPEISDPVVLKALDIIYEKMHTALSMGELATACYMSKDSFIRRFSRVVGMTPYAYLKNLRLSTALYLRAEGVNLADIAEQTGYADASSLLHALKKRM